MEEKTIQEADKVGQPKDILETVLYKKQPFSPIKIDLIKFQKLHTFSPKNIAEEIKNIDSDQITKNIMTNASATVKKQRSKKSRWWNTIFLLLNLVVLALVLWWQLSSEETVSLEELLTQKINWWWLLFAVGVFMLINIFDGIRVWVLIKYSTGRSRPWLSYKSIITQRFYDAITPLATGGQPFQVFYLNKRGLSASSATSVPLAKWMYASITNLFFIVFIFIIKSTFLISISPVIMSLCYIGLILNLLLMFAILFLSVSKKVAPSMMVGLLKLGKKLHLIKDYRRKYVQVMKVVREYVATSRKFMSNGWIILCEIFVSLLVSVFSYSMPFFIYCAFGHAFDLNIWVELIALAMVCDMAVSFVPIPGGAGMAELSFKALFASMFSSCAAWAILMWRFFTYYGFLLQGVILMFYDFAFGNKKIQPLLDKFKEEDARKHNKKL